MTNSMASRLMIWTHHRNGSCSHATGVQNPVKVWTHHRHGSCLSSNKLWDICHLSSSIKWSFGWASGHVCSNAPNILYFTLLLLKSYPIWAHTLFLLALCTLSCTLAPSHLTYMDMKCMRHLSARKKTTCMCTFTHYGTHTWEISPVSKSLPLLPHITFP